MRFLFPKIVPIVLTAIAMSSGIAKANNIPVANPGFEEPDQTVEAFPGAGVVGFFEFNPPTNWELYDPNNLVPPDVNASNAFGNAFTGAWKPSDLFPPVPEGDQIVSIYVVPPGAGVVGLSQTTSVNIQPKTRYNLSVAIGNPETADGFFDGFPGYTLELLAGDTIIATDNNTVSIDESDFRRASVSYTSTSDDIYVGEPLAIRLINPNLDNNSGPDGNNGREVTFDDVQLQAFAVPESGAFSWQLSLLLVSIGAIMRIKPKNS